MNMKISAILFCMLCFSTTANGSPKAGFMTSTIVNFAGEMTITVWYPTARKDQDTYHFPGALGVATSVPAGASRDARIKGGKHPLIIAYPGAGAADSRFQYFPNAELLAADGYIVVIPGRNTELFEQQVPLLKDLIDHMLYYHAIRDSIDASRIGAKGYSFGGIGVAALATGDVYGNASDTRVRGIILDEGAVFCGSLHPCTQATVPIMLRDGGQYYDISDMAPEFAAFDNAIPRFRVTLDRVSHLSFSTGVCQLTESFRQDSQAYQQTFGLNRDPRDISYLLDGTATAIGDAAGITAAVNWNLDTFFAGGIGLFGSAGDFCRSEYGGPAPAIAAVGAPLLNEQTVIETLHATDLAFWQTVFGEGQSKRTKLEKAVAKLDTVKSFVMISH